MKPALRNGTDGYQHLIFNAAKPEQEVLRIIECLIPLGVPVIMQEGGGVLNLNIYNKKQNDLPVILLLSGQINFIRKSSGGILFGSARAPSVLGLQGSSFRFNVFKYMAVGDCDIRIVPRNAAIDLINEQQLAREVLNYHAYIADMEVNYSNRLINRSSYEMVYALLYELAELPDPVRLKTGVAKFIIERSNIGRSGLMRILADLRKGKYVDIQNGKLIKILNVLPKVY